MGSERFCQKAPEDNVQLLVSYMLSGDERL